MGGVLAAEFRPLYKLLRQRLHGPQDLGRRAETDHLKGPYGLMQLLAGNPQLAGIDLGQVRAACGIGIANKAPQGLGRAIERFAQFIQHPGQRAEVACAEFPVELCADVGLHPVLHSCH